MAKSLKGVPEVPLKPPEGVVVARINAETGLRESDGGGITEYFYSEFPPRQREDAWPRRDAGAARSPQPAFLGETSPTLAARSPGGGSVGRAAFPTDMPRAESSRVAMGSRSRVRIAQATARLIAEHGLTDWSAAKRKACRELGLADNEPLPANDEVEQALRDYNSLFRRDAQAASLREQRRAALGWMDRLAAWHPVLIGGVAAGWATEHSEVRIELEAEDPKAVELGLINAGVDYAPGGRQRTAASWLRVAASPRSGS